jgi:hypothetical protein
MTDPTTLKLVDNIGAARGTDYFLMKEQLTKEEVAILEKVRKFGETEVLPVVNPYWERGEFPFVHLNKTGYVLLTGDAVHFQSNWDNRRVPGSTPIARCHWTRWTSSRASRMRSTPSSGSNHDKSSSDARRHAPEFYD